MLTLWICLAVLSVLALVFAGASLLKTRGRSQTRSGPEVWSEMQQERMDRDSASQGIYGAQRVWGRGKGVAWSREASMSFSEVKAAWRDGQRRQVVPFVLGLGGLVGLLVFMGLALLTGLQNKIVGGVVLAMAAYLVWRILLDFCRAEPAAPASPGRDDGQQKEARPGVSPVSDRPAPTPARLEPRAETKVLRQIGAIFAVAGLLTLGGGIFFLLQARAFVRETVTAPGTISALVRSGTASNSSRPMYSPVIRFTPAGGHAITFESKWSSTERLRIGTPVSVRYRKSDPQSAVENTFMSVWGLGTIFTAGGLACSAVGTLLLYLARARSASRPATLAG